MIRFGRFRLDPVARRLERDGRAVRLGDRAFDLLVALVRRPGEIIAPEALLRTVWPEGDVSESNLRGHLATLRRAIDDHWPEGGPIRTVPLRGYCFVANVDAGANVDTGAKPVEARAAASTPPRRNLPMRLQPVFGRDRVIAIGAQALERRRLLTLVGSGGVGKTTVAISLAEHLLPRFADGVCFVDLGPIADPSRIPAALSAVLSLTVLSDDPMPALVAHLATRAVLIVLDNCEHLIDAVAPLAETLLRGTASVRLLATSREPLRCDGEWIHRLAPLDLPDRAEPLTRETALGFAAIEFFVERASAADADFDLTSDDLPAVLEICFRLDGIPLAIELAAARIGVFGARALAAQLADRFTSLTDGRRTALPRQKTLQATLDWSYRLLDGPDQRMLQRLSVFPGAFTIDSALAVAAGLGLDRSGALASVAELVAKSLIGAEPHQGEMHYRLLVMTRTFARDALVDAVERRTLARLHADHCLDLLDHARRRWSELGRAAWIATYGRRLDDIRQALDWAFAEPDGALLGIRLTVASNQLLFQLSLMDELRRGAERALASLADLTAPDPSLEMQLQAELGLALAHSQGPGHPGQMAACTRALVLARQLGDAPQQMQMLYRLWHSEIGRSDHPAAMARAEAFEQLCRTHGNDDDILVGHRMMMIGRHAMGDQPAGLSHAEHLGALASQRTDGGHAGSSTQVDDKVMALAYRGRILWLTGRPDTGWDVVREAVDVALARGHDLSLFQALGLAACPVAFWRGDLEAASIHVDRLDALARDRSVGTWAAWARLYRQALAARSASDGFESAPTVSARLASPYTPSQREHLATLGDNLCDEEVLRWTRADERKWCAAEILRTAAPGIGAAACLHRCIGLARQQGALAWALRSATDLAVLLHGSGRADEARAVLEPIRASFREGASTRDLTRADRILSGCR